MKFIKNKMCTGSLLLLLLLFLTGCPTASVQEKADPAEPIKETSLTPNVTPVKPVAPKALPVEYQSPTYQVGQQDVKENFSDEETSIKVGATIRSNSGAMPLGDILKKLAALKDMNVSWASDVDRDVLVDVDITANDDFYDAIDNLLRQVDYFHEIKGNTIVVRYKETRQFHVAMPFIKSTYRTSAGGNLLGNNEESENVDGTVALESADNAFDIWDNIQANMDAILDTWSTSVAVQQSEPLVADAEVTETTPAELTTPATATRRYSSGGNMYIIDRPVGIITVVAPRNLVERVETYLDALKKELYKQIAIDAKIVEVTLADSSSVGIDWTNTLGGLKIGAGASYNFNFGNTKDTSSTSGNSSTNSSSSSESTNIFNEILDPNNNNGDNTNSTSSSSSNSSGNSSNFGNSKSKGYGFEDGFNFNAGISDFGIIISALNTQGETKILSNPKLSVMNGQPALISVGRSITYIKEIEADRDDSGDNDTVTYTTETASLLSGLGMGITATILDNNEIILNLVPVTSELATGQVEYRQIGDDGGSVGLPELNVREISTTIRAKNGDTLVIGGLISEVEKDGGTNVPVLGSIPGLGRLFSSDSKSVVKKELVILIKPRII